MARFDDDYYTEIKKDMVSAFRKLGFIRIPVDPVELMGACGIHAIPYLSAFDQGELMNLTLLTDCPSGVSFALREEDGTETRYAAYNNFESSGRTRFTAMHEFCHCFFNHRESSEVAERIADFGPGYALAPPVLIDYLRLTTVSEVAERFGVSQQCAFVALATHRNWLRHRNADAPLDNEILRLYRKGQWIEQSDQSSTNHNPQSTRLEVIR